VNSEYAALVIFKEVKSSVFTATLMGYIDCALHV